MSNSGNNYDYIFIEPKYLRTDPSYQRDIDYKRVNQIVKNFNPNLFNEPKVSKRDDGFYYIFNGDHSVAAHQIMFGKDTPIKCKVYYGLTPEEEMKLFVLQNGISKEPTKLEKLRARNNHNDPDVAEMVECAEIAKIKIDFTPWPQNNKIAAVETAFSVFQAIGRTSFINMLDVIKKSWLGDADSFSRGIIKGFGYLYKRCADQLQGIPNKDLVAAFTGYPISKIIERATSLQGSMERRYAQALVEQYNKRKRTRRITLPEK